MTRTWTRLAVGAFSVAALAGAAYVSLGGDEPVVERAISTTGVVAPGDGPDVVAFSTELRSDCDGQPMSCDAGKIQSLAGVWGTQTAFAAYGDVLELDGWAVPRCHTTTHQFGRWAYGTNGEADGIDNVILAGGPACEWGYLHGALEAWGQDVGPDTVAGHATQLCEILADSNAYSEGYNDSICTHAVGHSLGWGVDDLATAVPLCDVLERPDAISSCASGVVMLYLQRDIEATGRSDPAGYAKFCTSLTGLGADVCGQSYGPATLNDGDPETAPADAVRACQNAATAPSKETCADLTGRQLAMQSLFDPDIIIESCAAGADLERSCLSGAVAAHTVRPGAPDVSVLCGALDDEWRLQVCPSATET